MKRSSVGAKTKLSRWAKLELVPPPSRLSRSSGADARCFTLSKLILENWMTSALFGVAPLDKQTVPDEVSAHPELLLSLSASISSTFREGCHQRQRMNPLSLS